MSLRLWMLLLLWSDGGMTAMRIQRSGGAINPNESGLLLNGIRGISKSLLEIQEILSLLSRELDSRLHAW
jgi:hypothetical protein